MCRDALARTFVPVQGDLAQGHHAGGLAQLKGLQEHVRQGGQVPFAEAGDRAEVRSLLGCQPPERDHIRTGPLDLAGGTHPDAVSVEHDAQHQPWVIRRLALGLLVGSVKAGQVQFVVNELGDAPGQMALRQPLIQGRRDQHHRIRIKRPEPFVHPAPGIHHIINDQLDALHESLVKQAILRLRRRGRNVGRRSSIHAPILPATPTPAQLISRRLKKLPTTIDPRT